MTVGLHRGAARGCNGASASWAWTSEWRVRSFDEKPADAARRFPGSPDKALASMGIYVFNAKFLYEQVTRDTDDPHSAHDFGKDIIPHLVPRYRVFAHRFQDSCVGMNDERPYWRDVGTVDAYWEANIDLTHVTPELNLYDEVWPIWTYPGAAAAGQVRVRRRRPPRHGGRFAGVRRLHHQRLDACAARCCFPTCACTASARSRIRLSCPM